MRLLVVLAVALSLLSSAASGVTLELWHAFPDSARTIQSLATRYYNQTGTAFKIRAVRPAARMSWGRSGPDIAILNRPTKPDIQSMAAQGLIQNISPEMARGWYAIFWSPLLDTFSVRGSSGTGVYGVPLTAHVHVFVYNRSLFQKARVSVPRTWSEMMAAAARLRKIGVRPYAGGFGSSRPAFPAVYEYAYLGSHLLAETYAGRYPYTASSWLANLKIYSDMRRYGFTTLSSATMSETSAMKALIDGQVAIIFVDQSFETIRRKYRPSFTAWGAFGPPEDSRARFLPRLPGGVVGGLVINSRSSRRAQAIAFARWLTEYNQQLTLGTGTWSVPAQSVASQSGQLISPLRVFGLVGMHDMAADLRVYENPRVLSVFYSGVRGILAGSTTPSAVARRARSAKGR